MPQPRKQHSTLVTTVWITGGMIVMEKQNTKQQHPSAIFSTTNPTDISLDLNPGLGGISTQKLLM
jgi:hypothetical protein